MPNIWVANAAGHPYHKAKQLQGLEDAEIHHLTLEDINPLYPDRLNWHIARAVVKYIRADDYLLISGTPMVNAAALLLWMIHFGECNLLQWVATKRIYKKSHLTMDNLNEVLAEQMVRT